MSFHLICVALPGLWCCLSISTAGVSYPKTLPCDVTEANNGSVVTVDCTERSLSDIPLGIPRDTTNLTLTINHIPKLNSTSFQGLENLTEIDMRCNCVPIKIGPKDHMCTQSVTIEENTFTSLRNLRALYLDGNQLDSIPKGLPSNLILLSLEVNHIFNITKANLSEIRNVQMLYLSQNCYYRNPCNNSYAIEEGAFLQLENLTLLCLKSNNLSFIPHQLPTSLKELYLYNNNIQRVTDEDFKNLSNLEILDISGNCPRCYNAPFPCDPCPNNSPLNISKSAFKMLTKLKTLRMHSNSLTCVPSEWFASMTELRVLDLSQNFLAREIGVTSFPRYLGKLEELDLSFNYELQRYPQTLKLSCSFSSLKSLKVFRLKGYVFQQLMPESIAPLKPLTKLEVVDLGTNFIKMTNLSILMELKSFRIISLSDNKISSPSDGQDTVGFSGGEPLNWSPMSAGAQYQSNEVREIHYFRYDEYARKCKYKDKELGVITSFVKRKCSQFGKTLDVSRNNIFFLHSRFLNFGELRCLNLSGNAMSQSLNGSEFTYLTKLKYLDFSSNRLDLLYSTAFKELKSLVILDISNNNHYFESEGLTHMLNFTKNLKNLKVLMMNHNKISTSTNTELESQSLERLEFRDNRLDLLWRDGDTRYVNYFKKLLNLTVLDISNNNLHYIPPPVFSGLPDRLSELYIKNNKLNSFDWENLQLLQFLRVLDLGGNSLTTVPLMLSNCAKSLKKLILHKNKIVQLTPDFLKNAYKLKHLDLSYNYIQHIEKSSFPDDVVKEMDKLLLHRNKFLCSCNATWFVKWLNQTTVTIPRLATEVTCDSPGAQKGHPVVSVDLLACQHNYLSIILYILTTSLIFSFLILSISSHLFLWDVWYIYHFCRAKLKGYTHLYSQSSTYDAFVIYDKDDPAVTEWVMKEMCIHLEDRGDRQLTLCLEERDWIPGCPLIDNLSQSIHKSKRTVFILTSRYIKSGNFKTAFYMAHQRLMDEKNDVIVLIFLEKVPCNSKYLRLRKRLYKRSVLEWPTNPQAQPYFWFSLRSVLATESHKQYNNLFKETLAKLKGYAHLCSQSSVYDAFMIYIKEVKLVTITGWTHLLLFCLVCHDEIPPAVCKPRWMSPQFPCDVTPYNTSKVVFDCKGRHLHQVPDGITDLHVSEWVMRNLRVKLEEEGEKYLPLCLEERDWPPGVPLVDNLTQSIRYSRKTLFVLTESYVKTGVFKLAMYLAHQRLLDENVDVIVLLMLEPVLQHSHFLRLRRRLCGESVVEWPRTAAAEPWFWQNLRNVVRVDNQVMYNKTYSKYFTSN
ncbi:toll-like receptor 7 [Symphorus nematophorus]